MSGPKLDSRAYTVLLLAVVASLLAMNLVAQSNKTTLTEAGSSAAIASATMEVARANMQIAQSIDRLAQAVGTAQFKIEMPKDGSQSGGGAAPAGTGGNAAPAGQQPAGDPMVEGQFKLSK